MEQQDKDPRIEAAAAALWGHNYPSSVPFVHIRAEDQNAYRAMASVALQAADQVPTTDPRVDKVAESLYLEMYSGSFPWLSLSEDHKEPHRRLARIAVDTLDDLALAAKA